MNMSTRAKLMEIQTKIKAPKNLYNTFGKYRYRNAESIYEAVKPFLAEQKCTLVLSDEIVEVGGRIYVKATATLRDLENENCISISAYAREAEQKSGMDASQITGTASSYARKYALNGLFLLDDTKDADDVDENGQTEADKAEAFDRKADEIAVMKIPPVKVGIIKKKCADDGIPEEKVLKLYKISSFENMTEKQFKNATDNWKKIKEM